MLCTFSILLFLSNVWLSFTQSVYNFDPPSYSTTFSYATLTILPQNDTIDKIPTRSAFDFRIDFRLERSLLGAEQIVFRLPRFTRNMAENKTFYQGVNISMGKELMISPSYRYMAEWVEANDGRAETPYFASHLTLKTQNGLTLFQGEENYTVYVYKENGIGAYCGFPSEAEYHDLGHGRVSNNLAFPFFERPRMWTSIVDDNGGLFNVTIPTNDSYSMDTWTGVGRGCASSSQYVCSDHGTCDYCRERCSCFDGYGSARDTVTVGGGVSVDCSARVCPSGRAITDLPSSTTMAHDYAECSNRGICDRSSGNCRCFPGYTGGACERQKCPNDCSGHGQCVSMEVMAQLAKRKTPNQYTFQYGSAQGIAEGTTWDYDVVHGCVCDSPGWEVGYDDGQLQLGEYFGADCSLRRCPSGDDPFTFYNESYCKRKQQVPGSPEYGSDLNGCYVACSNRGTCDYTTGTCTCFAGSWGAACDQLSGAGRRQVTHGSLADASTFRTGN